MAPGLGARLRFLARQFSEEMQPIAAQHQDVRDAAVALVASVAEAFPEDARRRRGRQYLSLATRLQRERMRNKWLRAKLKKAEIRVKDLTIGQQAAKTNRMTPEFLAKVSLSWPTTCARGFASAWQDLVGVGVAGCSRTAITRIRDAFAETVKEMNVKDVAAFLQRGIHSRQSARQSQSSAAGAPAESASLLCAALLHIHDEASLRLRSASDNIQGAGPSRSRSSKVQQHSAFVQTHSGGFVRFLTELDALANKTAAVLANSLHKVLRDVAAVVGTEFGVSALLQRPWLIHVLVSDGLGTNEAAAKIVLAWIRANPLPNGLRYFVMLVRCANHQINLAVSSVVCGRAALLGVQNVIAEGNPLAQRPSSHRPGSCASNICGAIVRLFKFLVSDYYADFFANLQELVSRLRACAPSAARHAERQKWEGLAQMYGPSVFPPGLLDVLNGGLGSWSTHSESESAAEAPVGLAQSRLLELLRRRLLVVDEHPTLSRMFTFQPHVDALLLMLFLDCFDDLVKLRGINPRERNRNRVTKVRAFLKDPGSMQYLRRTSLALNLTSHVQNVCAQLRDDVEPLLVRLAKGEVHDIVCNDLKRVLLALHLDASLDVNAAVALLFGTAIELCLRFEQYRAWPYQAWTLCRVFNRQGYIVACMNFVQMPSEQLDIGFGLELQNLVRRSGPTDQDRVRYLLGDEVQNAIALAFKASAVSSLPAERAFAELKRSEAPRLCHVATASRNAILRQHLRQRRAIIAQAETASQVLRGSLRMNVQALAWQKRPELSDKALSRNSADMRAFIEAHKRDLEEELAQRRAAAKADFERVAPDDSVTPVTQQAWISWFRRHEDAFYQRMASAGATRKQCNRRLESSNDTPRPVHRVGIQTTARPTFQQGDWQQYCWGRSGWHIVKTRRGPRLLFLYTFKHRTFATDLTSWQSFSNEFALRPHDDLRLCVLPLQEIEIDAALVVAEAFVSAACAPDSAAGAPAAVFSFKVTHAQAVKEQVPPARGKKRRARVVVDGGEDDDSSASSCRGSDDESDAVLKKKIAENAQGSSSDDSGVSVDTDADSGIDEAPAADRRKRALRDHLADDLEDPLAERAPSASSSASEREPDGDDLAPVPLPRARLPAGTWKTWESVWFYITQTPGWADVKIVMKMPFRDPVNGMGSTQMSKTLTPRHYGDTLENPWRSLLLLRAWSIWRARHQGWASKRECRLREVASQARRLEQSLRAAHENHGLPLMPLLANVQAAALLSSWVPDVVASVSA